MTRPLIYQTFQEWKDMGYHVMKGAKSTQRNSDGFAVFSEEQVEDSSNDFEYADSSEDLYMSDYLADVGDR